MLQVPTYIRLVTFAYEKLDKSQKKYVEPIAAKQANLCHRRKPLDI